MEQERVLTDIPDDQKAQVVADFQSEGAAVTVVRQKNGRWTVRASFGKPQIGGAQS